MHDPLETFHRYNTCQREHRPYSLKATSTHDTKRGEDVRARINVLSEIPDSWQARLSRWMGWNGRRKKLWGNESVPDSDMEMLIYQSMLGAWPFFSSELPEFKDRFKAYVIKAAREAKAYTGWLSINQEYEEALLNFTGAILDLPAADRFMRDFLSLQKEIAYYGVFNSLSQVVLKVASPGVVDLYRGTELWDLSLVDPDNRRPVDFDLRRSMMDEMDGEIDAATLRELMLAPEDGRIKLYAVTKALKTRMEYPDLFLNGDYLPLDASGECRGHIAAFARRFEGWWALAVVPRLLTRLIERGSLPVGERPWAGTGLELPPDAPRCWHNVFTGDSIERDECVRLPLSSVFRSFPVALLLGQKNRRHKGQGEYGRFQPSSQPSPVSAEGEAEIRSLSTATFFRSREKDKPAFGRFQLRPSFAPARRRSECTDLPG
ncbi:MAG: hypothetical protein IBX68_11645 [Dehalococcoidia bacterium]|nr:hypothetical protein [Dehalococcoidia bacterium]